MTELQTIKWKTTPVDFDPFAGEKAGYKLTPVDFDPFKEEPRTLPAGDISVPAYYRETIGPFMDRGLVGLAEKHNVPIPQFLHSVADVASHPIVNDAANFLGITRSIPGYKGSLPVFNPEVAQLLRTRRAEGVSANKIAQELGVSHTAVNKWVKQLDMDPSAVGQPPVLDPELVMQKYLVNPDTKAIAHEFGVSRQAVEALVRKMDLVPKERGTPSLYELSVMKRDPFAGQEEFTRRWTQLEDSIRSMREKGASTDQIAKELGISRWTVNRKIQDVGLKPRASGAQSVISPEMEALIRVRNEQGVSAHKIAQELGISSRSVDRWLRRSESLENLAK